MWTCARPAARTRHTVALAAWPSCDGPGVCLCGLVVARRPGLDPAVTIGRAFTDTFAGIAPASVPGFIVAQLVGLVVGVGLLLVFYPTTGAWWASPLAPLEIHPRLFEELCRD